MYLRGAPCWLRWPVGGGWWVREKELVRASTLASPRSVAYLEGRGSIDG